MEQKQPMWKEYIEEMIQTNKEENMEQQPAQPEQYPPPPTEPVLTEEEKKAGIWVFKGTKFKRCQGCNKGIPAEWNSHQCGWGKVPQGQPADAQAFMPGNQVQSPPQFNAKALMNQCLCDAMELLEAIGMNMAEEGKSPLDWTTEDIRTIANSMFIQASKAMGVR